MTQLIPIIILALLLAAFVAWNRRNRAKAQLADDERRSNLHPGSEIMTTSGLYGTVVSVDHEDDSVRLAIAPGVEVKWTIAALRSVTELPPKYRDAIGGQGSAAD